MRIKIQKWERELARLKREHQFDSILSCESFIRKIVEIAQEEEREKKLEIKVGFKF